MHALILVTFFASLASVATPSTGAPASADRFSPPAQLTVVTDINYPPYLFQGDDGQLRGILREKWALWSRKTGVPVKVIGMDWEKAQDSVRSGNHDVIEALAYTVRRAGFYEFSPPYSPIEARLYFHRTISGISNDVTTMRGFTIGAKAGSACANWLAERGLEVTKSFATSEALVRAAGTGEIRLFCMDAPAAQYFLFKHNLADAFRQSSPLYVTQFHWAVKKGSAELRDFIQRGFDGITPQEIEAIEAGWLGNPLRFPIATRYLYYIATGALAVLCAGALLLLWNRTLRRRVAARTAELSTLSRRLLEAQEAERRAIARELHDEVGQQLTAVLFTLRALKDMTTDGEFLGRLDEGAHFLNRVIDEIRNTSIRLRPTVLDDLGLVPALRWLVAQHRRATGADISLELAALSSDVPPEIATGCFRIVQESITNAVRHARASHVRVRVGETAGSLDFEVEDNGRGFDLEHARLKASEGRSSGLTGMRERTELLGGTLEIRAAPGRGTVIHARLPLEVPAALRASRRAVGAVASPI